MLRSLAQGAAAGAAVGAVLSGVAHLMRERRAAAEDLGVDGVGEHLAREVQLSELLSRFKPLGRHCERSRLGYEALVRACEDLLRYASELRASAAARVASPGAPSAGVLQMRANRAAYAAKREATLLCKAVFAQYRDDLAAAMLAEVPQLEALCNNHLHNMMV